MLRLIAKHIIIYTIMKNNNPEFMHKMVTEICNMTTILSQEVYLFQNETLITSFQFCILNSAIPCLCLILIRIITYLTIFIIQDKHDHAN